MLKKNEIPVITFDGPAGSGKGTIGRALAQHLGWHFLESGALYRLLAYAAIQTHTPREDEVKLVELAYDLRVQFTNSPEGQPQTLLDDQDVTQAIRDEACGDFASFVAVNANVRSALMARQRAFRCSPGLVADGRDMGTVVFPDATLKFYLDASVEERAQRRLEQLKAQGIDANLHKILDDLKARDQRDQERSVAPLKPASDALIVDTTQLPVEGVKQKVWQAVSERFDLNAF